MMYVNQIMGLVSSIRNLTTMYKVRKNPELQKAREMMKQQELQARQRADS
jgi:hypothetical protein